MELKMMTKEEFIKLCPTNTEYAERVYDELKEMLGADFEKADEHLKNIIDGLNNMDMCK